MANYWGDSENELVMKYRECTSDEERNKCFNLLYNKLIQLIESVMKKYKFNYASEIEFEEIKSEIVYNIVKRLNYSKNLDTAKSFSLFGTIARNYLKDIYRDSITKYSNKFIKNNMVYDTDHILKNENEYIVEDIHCEREEIIKQILQHIDSLLDKELKSEYGYLYRIMLLYFRYYIINNDDYDYDTLINDMLIFFDTKKNYINIIFNREFNIRLGMLRDFQKDNKKINLNYLKKS